MPNSLQGFVSTLCDACLPDSSTSLPSMDLSDLQLLSTVGLKRVAALRQTSRSNQYIVYTETLSVLGHFNPASARTVG